MWTARDPANITIGVVPLVTSPMNEDAETVPSPSPSPSPRTDGVENMDADNGVEKGMIMLAIANYSFYADNIFCRLCRLSIINNYYCYFILRVYIVIAINNLHIHTQ